MGVIPQLKGMRNCIFQVNVLLVSSSAEIKLISKMIIRYTHLSNATKQLSCNKNTKNPHSTVVTMVTTCWWVTPIKNGGMQIPLTSMLLMKTKLISAVRVSPQKKKNEKIREVSLIQQLRLNCWEQLQQQNYLLSQRNWTW